MAVNIYDSANQIEQDLRQTNEYLELKSAYDEMKQDEAAFSLFKKFQEIQLNIQQKQMSSQQLSDDEIDNARAVADEVAKVPAIQALMAKERNLNSLLTDLNKIITQPIQDLYRS